MRELNREDMLNILNGCQILGTGGGGPLADGMEMIDEALSLGKTIKLASFDEIPEDSYIGTPYGCGAISPLDEETRKKYERLPEAERSPYLIATEWLESYLGKNVDAFITTELGGMNSAVAFYSAAMTGRYVADGDPAGRSVPALQHSTYFLDGIPMCPMGVCNDFGEGGVFASIFDDTRGEDLVRALAAVSRNEIAVVDHVNTAEKIASSVIKGAITRAEKIGKAYLDAVNANKPGEEVAAVVRETAGGKQMFSGVIKSNEYETRDGYTFGDMYITGNGEWEGHELRIWYQNENIMSWLDGEFYVCVPELIVVFNLDDMVPQTNPYAKAGTNVSVECLPADEPWMTPAGLDCFGPRSFGFDKDWTPFLEY